MYRTENWWVSPYNFEPEVMKQMHFPKRVKVHDLTLRDGEQMAGVIFDEEDKVAIAQKLDAVGVDRVEAGNPIISEAEKKSVKAVANLGLKAKVFCLSRSVTSDVDLALNCDVDGILLYSPGSKLQMDRKLGWTIERAIETPAQVAEYAKSHGLQVAYAPYDTTRADLPTLRKIVERVIQQGKVDSICIFDTVGCITPQGLSLLVRGMREFCKVPIEIHAHNDFGMAVANTVAAIASGAEVVQAAVNGLGERCGNAATEEVAVALKVLYGIETNIDISKLYELSKLVEERSRVKMAINKPVVGVNPFRFEAGLVVDGIAKFPLTMEPMLPEVVGQKNTILLGKKSGRSSIVLRLSNLGRQASQERVDAILEKVKRLAETEKRVLTDQEFEEIVREVLG